MIPSSAPVHDPWRITWVQPADPVISPNAFRSSVLQLSPTSEAVQADDPQLPTHAAAVEFSDAYQLRRKIHKYASFATIPLFATELALGQSLYNPDTVNGVTVKSSGANKGLHALVGAGIVGLFGVNTVTGAWNLFGEGWSEPNGRTLRLLHGLLMMASDAGFVATTATAPSSGGRNGTSFDTNKVLHRNLAVASISVGTLGYLIMLFGNH